MAIGRKNIISESIIKDAVKLLKGGHYVLTICDYLGIHQSTWYRWMNEGEALLEEKRKLKKTEELTIKFYEEVKKASARAEINAVSGILEHGQAQWQALAWYLERRNYDKWGKKEKIEHSGGLSNVNKNIDLSAMSDEEIEKELKKYE